MAKHIVKRPVEHDGVRYEPGDEISSATSRDRVS